MMAVAKNDGVVDRVKRSIGFHKSPASKDVKLDLEHLKCVFVGDGAVGKSTLLWSFTKGKYINIGYVPTVSDQFAATVMVDGKHVQLELWDTPGMEDYDRIRPLTYPQTDVFLICFAVGNQYVAFANILNKWYPEVRHHCPNVPIVLVACQVDLRNDTTEIARLSSKGLAPLTYTQGLEVQKKIGAVAYAECSALTYEGVTTLFEEVIPAAAMSAIKKQKGGKMKNFLKEMIIK